MRPSESNDILNACSIDGTIDGAASVLARLSAVVDELQSLDLTTLPGDHVLDVLRDLEVQKRRLARSITR